LIASVNTTMPVPDSAGEKKEVQITILYIPKARSDFTISEVIFHHNNTKKAAHELTTEEYNYVDAIVLEKRKGTYVPINENNNKFFDHTLPKEKMQDNQTREEGQKREYPPMQLDAKIPFGEGMKIKGNYVIEALLWGGKEFKDNSIEWLAGRPNNQNMFDPRVLELSRKYKQVRKDKEFMAYLAEQIAKMVETQFDLTPEEEQSRF